MKTTTLLKIYFNEETKISQHMFDILFGKTKVLPEVIRKKANLINPASKSNPFMKESNYLTGKKNHFATSLSLSLDCPFEEKYVYLIHSAMAHLQSAGWEDITIEKIEVNVTTVENFDYK